MTNLYTSDQLLVLTDRVGQMCKADKYSDIQGRLYAHDVQRLTRFMRCSRFTANWDMSFHHCTKQGKVLTMESVLTIMEMRIHASVV